MATKTITIRGLEISPPLLMAPMAGVTHSALRTLVSCFGGVGLFSTEMLSARRLPVENPLVSPYLLKTELERPLSYQLLLTSPKEVKPAVAALHKFGADAIDLNLGCPAPRIRNAGGGGSLMADSRAAREIVSTTRKLTTLPLTAKIRLGKELDRKVLLEFCTALADEGIDLLTVHARLLGEKFCRPPRWEWIGHVKEKISIPVVANGSIFSVDDARSCLRLSGADGLMIGRAVPCRPWVFADIAREVYGHHIPRSEMTLPEIFLRLAYELFSRFREERRLGRLKEFTHYFAGNYPYGHHLASVVQSSKSFGEAVGRAMIFFGKNDEQSLRAVMERKGTDHWINELLG